MRRIDRDPGFLDRRQRGEWKGLDVDNAAPSPPPCSAMRRSSRSRRSIRNNASPRCSPARSTLTRNTTVTLTRDTTLGLIGGGRQLL